MIFCYSKRVKQLKEENTYESILDYEKVMTFYGIEELYLNDNNLIKIKNETFQHLKLLKKLWLNFNLIQSINQNVFTGLDNLEELDLNANTTLT